MNGLETPVPAADLVEAAAFIADHKGEALRIQAANIEVGDLWVYAGNDRILVREITHRRVSRPLLVVRYENALNSSNGETSFRLEARVVVLR